MTILKTNSPKLETGAVLRGLAKMQSWSSFSGQMKNRVKTLLESNPITSLDDVGSIVAQTSLQGRKAKNLQTSLGIVVAALLQGKKPDDIMGDPNSHFQVGEYIKRGSHETEISATSRDIYNSHGEPLAVDKILQRASRYSGR